MSSVAAPAVVAQPKTTASAPLSVLIVESLSAMVRSASSQVISFQPGSGSPFGRVRRIGRWRRSGA
jgi:uncharacterized protein (DUF302 family)